METTVTKRGQTVVPASIRHRYNIQAGDRIAWIDDGSTIRVVPVPDDPIIALEGSAQGEGLVTHLLQTRRMDARNE